MITLAVFWWHRLQRKIHEHRTANWLNKTKKQKYFPIKIIKPIWKHGMHQHWCKLTTMTGRQEYIRWIFPSFLWVFTKHFILYHFTQILSRHTFKLNTSCPIEIVTLVVLFTCTSIKTDDFCTLLPCLCYNINK